MAERIGDFLVRVGSLTASQLEEVMRLQKAGDRRKFGEIALELGYISDDAIKRYADYMEKTNLG
jgi:hypothetical protein